MNATEWTLVKSLFARALDLPAADREAWLRSQGELPAAVLDEVRRMLEHAGPDSLPGLGGAAQRTLQPGDSLDGRFVIERLLGRGGMGEVYLARDLVLDLNVAIKTVREDLLSDPVFSARLEQEIRAARRVQHQNICSVFDLHRAPGGLTYLSMEYLDGPTLAERLADGPLPLEELRPLAEQLAAGLDAIHQGQIIHRDLKSGNVFLLPGPTPAAPPRVVIADFGLAYDAARPITETISLFGAEAIVGTPAYMAPEQLLGKAPGRAADIHAFGVILFEAATGVLPFPGETPLAVALRRLENTAVPSPHAFNRAISPSWDHAIRRCLARDPAERPESAAAVVALFDTRPPRRLPRRALWTIGAGAAAAVASAIYLDRPRVHTAHPDAVYHNKLGLEYIRRTSNREILAAIKEFRQAAEIDPEFAEAWANLADAHCAAANHAALPGPVARKEAESAARRALSLDPRLVAAHTALAYVLATDFERWAQADQSFREAIGIAPNDAMLRSRYAAYLGRRGRFDEAIAMARSSLALEPAEFRVTIQLGAELFRARRFREMKTHVEQVVSLHPTEASGYLSLARANMELGDFAASAKALDTAERLLDEGDASAFRAMLYGKQGDRAKAEPLADQYVKEWRAGEHESNTAASVEAVLQRVDSVFQIIEGAWKRADDTVLAIPTNPHLGYLKDDPRMVAFRRRLQLPASA